MAEAPAPPYIEAKYMGGHQDPLNRIVLHSAVMDLYVGAAKALAEYGQNPSAQVSWHYNVDNHPTLYGTMGDSATYQSVYDNTVAWHDGYNQNSIGIEMCENPSQDVSRWSRAAHAKLLANTAQLTRDLCEFYGIPKQRLSSADIEAWKDGVHGHVAISNSSLSPSWHWDPGAFPWNRFMSLVRGEETDPNVPPPPVSDDYEEWPFPDSSDYFGPIDGPAQSHGGYNEWEQDEVHKIQARLQELGHAPSYPEWSDGIWEDPTTVAMRKFQRARGLEVDGVCTADDWYALFPRPSDDPHGGQYTIKPGDTLWSLAQHFPTVSDVDELVELNNLSDPSDISAWATLLIPNTDSLTIQSGDTLYGISQEINYEGGWEALAEFNRIPDPSTIQVGRTIVY